MYKWCVCTICLFAFFETERNLKSLYSFNLINFEMVTHIYNNHINIMYI